MTLAEQWEAWKPKLPKTYTPNEVRAAELIFYAGAHAAGVTSDLTSLRRELNAWAAVNGYSKPFFFEVAQQ